MDKKNNKERKKAIKELIKKYPIENQTELVELLKRHYAIETNQSLISRDLRDLNVIKHQVSDKLIYEIKQIDVTQEILRLGIVNIVHNETMIIIYTLAGLADFVGDYLDAQNHNAVVATLAGENVVFVVPASIKKIETTFTTVCQLVHFKIFKNKDSHENT